MKNRALVALLVAFVLALPALAQTSSNAQDQTNSNDQTNAAAQNPQSTPADQSSDQSSATSATGKPLQPPAREGFWGRVNPFARKKYVQRQTQPIRDRLNELDELTNANSKMIKDVDGRAQQGIQLASAKANEADQHAVDAGNKAQAAQQTATQANSRINTVEQVVSNIDQYKPTNQTEIRFRPGQRGGTKQIVFVKDGVRVTEFELQPGGVVPMHSYRGPHLLVAVSDLEIRNDVKAQGITADHFKSGDSKWLPPGYSNSITNTGKQAARFVTLEFP
jgi:quercetin dioxygenase-like cupin family protein/Ni/Co efflux regulator RcnB